jgi:DnaK suppressor protein
MNRKRLVRYQKQLKQLQQRLSGDVREVAHDIESNQASLKEREAYVADEIETDVLLGENEEAMLAEVQLAMARIESGSFGVCQDCKSNIRAARLNAIPYTSVCIGCEQQHESS